ncbi:MAG: hypothetical protein SGPRY_010027, partial [Prymnesium sp.]
MLLSLSTAAAHDFIVVGGGVAGSVVCDRLVSGTSSPTSILLLESGGPGHYVNGGRTPPPFDDATLVEPNQLTKFDVPGEYSSIAWNPAYDAYKQPEIGLGWQANVLGGGGLVSGALTMRPPSFDLDRMPSGWRSALEAQFDRLEQELHVTSTPSTDGLSYGGETRDILAAGMSQLYGTPTVGLNADPDGRENTLSIPTVTALNGQRQSSASFHLERAKASGRLELRLQATVTRLLINAAGDATGVLYTDSSGASQTAQLNPGGRVILTAGALATPRLLWLSGVGPLDELSNLAATGRLNGVSTRIDSPGVGAYLSDHTISTLTFKVPGSLAPDSTISTYLASRTGVLTQYAPTAVGYLRCETCSSAEEDVEIFIGPAGNDAGGVTSTFTISLMLLSSVTESKFAFQGSDNTKSFVADYGKLYMTDERDIDVMASAASKTINAVLAANSGVSVQQFGQNDWGPLNACDTADGHCAPGVAPSMDSIRNWLNNGWSAASNNRGQTNHFSGTCALGECASATDALVQGLSNVHVADASLLRHQLRAHPVLTVMALASEVAKRVLPP